MLAGVFTKRGGSLSGVGCNKPTRFVGAKTIKAVQNREGGPGRRLVAPAHGWQHPRPALDELTSVEGRLDESHERQTGNPCR